MGRSKQVVEVNGNMSDSRDDKYEEYNYDENLHHSGRGSGKNRSKAEAETNKHHDKSGPGHTRKIVESMRNNEQHQNKERKSSKD